MFECMCKQRDHNIDETYAKKENPEHDDQLALLKSFTRTVFHFFGGWKTMFADVTDPRDPTLTTYPLPELMCTGILMFLFRLGARRQITFKLRGNGPSQAKLEAWFDTEDVPHGDTLNHGFKELLVEELQAVVSGMVETLIRKKVLYRWRLFDNFTIAIDGTGMLTFGERHCDHCLTQEQNNGETLYYHPVLEAKLVTANGFVFSLMTEFIENSDPQADKQDCELRAFYRLAERLKKRFPRLPICLLLDGLYAGGPTFQLCEDYNWKYMIVLKDKGLPQIHRSFDAAWPFEKENHKRVLRGDDQEIIQEYRWVREITYVDSEGQSHSVSILACEESKPDQQGDGTTTTYKWLTNFTLTTHNVDTLANRGGRLRWKIENEGFNIQKNGGFEMEHPYSQDQTARKVFYYLLQVADMIFQLMEKGSIFRNAFPDGVGSLENIAFRLLEAWRNLRLSAKGLFSLYSGHYQIRFDSS